MSNKPNPGSKEAQVLGCVCPVLDNSYGKGYLGDGEKFGFVMNEHCPIHGTNQSPVTDKAWSFIQQFKRAIKRFNHSQRNVAKALGISEGSLSHILKGERLSLATKLTKDIRHYITYGTFTSESEVKAFIPNYSKEAREFTKIHYLRDDDYKPVGCLVAKLVAVSNHKDSPFFVAIGLSLCNTEHDSFNKKIGRELAIARAEEYWKEHKFVNRQISEWQDVDTELYNFIQSCIMYYKNKNIIFPKIVFIN